MRLLLGAVLIAVLSCRGSETAATDTLTRRERDSAIGASRIPGAKGVTSAIRAADSADARNARLDSLAADP